jgi:hypothetical protein
MTPLLDASQLIRLSPTLPLRELRTHCGKSSTCRGPTGPNPSEVSLRVDCRRSDAFREPSWPFRPLREVR